MAEISEKEQNVSIVDRVAVPDAIAKAGEAEGWFVRYRSGDFLAFQLIDGYTVGLIFKEKIPLEVFSIWFDDSRKNWLVNVHGRNAMPKVEGFVRKMASIHDAKVTIELVDEVASRDYWAHMYR